MLFVDDEYEIGDEVEEKKWWGRKGKRAKKHPDSMAPHEWITKRKKIGQLINKCDILVKAKPVSLSKDCYVGLKYNMLFNDVNSNIMLSQHFFIMFIAANLLNPQKFTFVCIFGK